MADSPGGKSDEDATKILPDELLIHIFKFLPLESILVCEAVCQRWNKLSRDSAIWRHILIVYSGKPGQSEVSEVFLEIIKTHSDRIYRLKIQYVYNYALIQSILEKCDNINSLELVMCRIGKEFKIDVNKWRNLNKLNLKNSLLTPSTADFEIKFDNFKELKYLSLAEFGLNSINCNTLLRCPHLSHILIGKLTNLDLQFVKELIISKQHILVTLHLYGGDSVDDNCLDLLSRCSKIKDLAFVRCENLTDKGLLQLANLQEIDRLQIWNNKNFTELALISALGSPNLIKLQWLSLSKIENISPVVIDVISEYYKNLSFLALYQCPKIIHTDYEEELKSKFKNIEVVLY